MSTDTLTEQLRKTYAKDFDARFERELQQPISTIIHRAELTQPMSLTGYVSLAQETIDWLKTTERVRGLKTHYINTRLSEAANFIKRGAGNGT